MTLTRLILTRDELVFVLNLERVFIERWLKAGSGSIPQMPHLPDLGKGTRFHLPAVEAWLLEHFQRGGALPANPKKK